MVLWGGVYGVYGAFMIDEEYISPNEAADRLQVSPKTIRKWCQARRLPYVKVGGRIRIRPADLELFVKRYGSSSEDRDPKHKTLALSY